MSRLLWNKYERNGMDISDELIGCYIEGTCTGEELQAVREYLVKNPEEYDRIICLMDNDRDYFIEPNSVNKASAQNENYLEFSLASAAFVPFDSSSPTAPKKDSNSSTLRNLQKFCDELDAI